MQPILRPTRYTHAHMHAHSPSSPAASVVDLVRGLMMLPWC